MATNKYFNLYHQKQEQNLVQSLVEEAVKIHGIDAVYIPRKNNKIDLLFREDVLANFEDYYFMEIYIKNIDSFDGDQDIFKKFGLEINNQVTFSVSRSGFNKNVGKERIRPREGDLIYLPMSTAVGLYEIRFVKEDTVFFNLGEFYIYDLQCELFAPANEDIKTGIEEIDEINNSSEVTYLVELGGGNGSFQVGETVYQGDSPLGADAKATVVAIVDENTIRVKDLIGQFDPDLGPIRGKTATYIIKSDDAIEINDNTFSAANSEYDKDSVIDFTEHNPFSEEDF
jgi:Virus neck protein